MANIKHALEALVTSLPAESDIVTDAETALLVRDCVKASGREGEISVVEARWVPPGQVMAHVCEDGVWRMASMEQLLWRTAP